MLFRSDGEVEAVAFGDTNLDINFADELVVAVKSNGTTKLEFWQFSTNREFTKLSDSIDLGNVNVTKLINLRRGYYQYDNDLETA